MKRPRQNIYEDALRIAWETLRRRDPAEVASHGLVELDEAGRIKVLFLGDSYFIDVDSQKVLFENGFEVYPFLSVLLLHYLVGVSGTSLAGEWIPFREFEGGTAYIGSFSDRSLAPLKKAFGDRPDHLVPAGEPLGAEPLELGDVGVRVPVFPKVPLAVILWRGDDEFPPEVNILYDKTANSILHTEDLAICGALTVSKLRKNAETMRKEE